MILILAMLGCTGGPPAPSAPPPAPQPSPIAEPAPKPAEPEDGATMYVGLPFIHKGLYMVSTEGTTPLLVALVQVTEKEGGGYYEEWLLTNKDGGIAGVDFANADDSPYKPYLNSFGTVGTLTPYPNRLPWTQTRDPNDKSTALRYRRFDPKGLAKEGLKKAACKTVLKDNAADVHYVTAAVTTQTPPEKPVDPTEDLDPKGKTRHWNEVFERVPNVGEAKPVGYMYAETETKPSNNPPDRSTRVWELVNAESFTSDKADVAPSRVKSGWPVAKPGDPEPLSRDAWFDAAVIALGETPKTLVSGTALGYNALACP